ncbi:MAG TPA: hypothetical protein VF041_00315 [Gemmatimonadaceae bacterium]
MPEVLVVFDEPIWESERASYRAQVCGRLADDGLWEGWIEFAPLGGAGVPLRTPRETSQPHRADLEYWATGLSVTYLQGALDRARRAERVPPPVVKHVTPSLFPGPAPHPTPRIEVRPVAVLDPFAAYLQGEAVLRRELNALSREQLEAVIAHYDLAALAGVDALPASDEGLVALIVATVRDRASARAP